MSDNDLAAAVERLQRVDDLEHGNGCRLLTGTAALREVYGEAPEAFRVDGMDLDWLENQLWQDRKTVADAYLAREADDAKPVTREWLDDRVVGRIENAYLRPHADGQGRCDAIQEIGGEWWAYLACMESAGSAAARRLDTRKQALAFLELAGWPTNKNGGE